MTFGSTAPRVAVVTGAAGGIGSALCAALASEGMRVAGLDRAVPPAACARSRSSPISPTSARGRSRPSRVSSVSWARRRSSSAPPGVVSEARPRELELEEWRRVVDASLTATFLACRAVVPGMRAAGSGRIVALSSDTPARATATAPTYAAAKAGVEALVKSLAQEVAADGVTVNAVAPGPVGVDGRARAADPARSSERSPRSRQAGRVGRVGRRHRRGGSLPAARRRVVRDGAGPSRQRRHADALTPPPAKV